MIGWLRRRPAEPPAPATVRIGGRDIAMILRRLDHARRLTLRIAPDRAGIRLSIPPWVPLAEALDFVRSREAWILAAIDTAPRAEPVGPGSVIRWRGTALTLQWDPRARRTPHIDGTTLVVGGPAETLPGRVARWLESEARRLIASDLADYCARAGRPVPALALSRARRRWGSCSARGTIRINWRLVMAPDAVRRQVVAHEVAHLVHFDHSPAFHALLASLFEGDVDATNRWLKGHGPSLYQPFG